MIIPYATDAPIYYFPASGRTLRIGMQIGG